MDTSPTSFEIPLRCNCGLVELLIHGSPMARAYCHCRSCRDLYDLPVLAATAWKKDAVRTIKGQDFINTYKHPTQQMQRHFCRACGTTVLGENRLDLFVIRTSLIAKSLGGQLPDALTPEFHLFYASREIDIEDDLPKYLEGWDGPLFSKHVSSER